ncbi:DUF7507 domain-containing protein [Methanohalobium evestigatum]|uniref:DUF7507 domain-containing protein n=1 Tax=Methanohalobium evestigatum TaxID=2322 RepID=UPI0006780C68|nr:hypothetical protein [Methanohalobium evestigatum]
MTPVTWNYTVTNTGNVNLSSVEVSDNQTAFTSSIGELAVGESTTVTNTSTAMEGQYANLGNVTGQYSNNITIDVTDEDPSHYFGVNASIDIEKSTNGDDADTPTGPEIGVGDPVTWNYTVTNTGNVNLSSVEVSDNQTAFTSSIGELAVGESTTVTNTSTAMEGQYTNLGNVTGQYSNNITIDVTDEDPSHYFGVNASIDIEKSTNGDDADTPTGPEIGVGDPVTWNYTVTNTGNVNLSSVEVSDNQTAFTSSIGELAVGESTTVTNTSTAMEGQYANLGNVTGQYSNNITIDVTDEDPSHYFGVNVSIDIEKSTNGDDADTPTGPEIGVGDTVTWNYTVTNTGNVNLSSVEVTDNVDGVNPTFVSGDTNGDGYLNVTETWIYNATGIAEEGQYFNIGNVTGEYEDTNVTDEDPSHYIGDEQFEPNPGIDIEKSTNGDDADTPTGPELTVGDTVTWTYTVNNTGNVPIENVQVTDSVTGVNPVYQSGDTNGDDVLQLNETWIYEATGTVKEGQYENVGDVSGDYAGQTVVDDDPSHYIGEVPFEPNLGIDIEKSTNGQDADTPTGPEIETGNQVTWTYTVTNTGNVPLENVQVTDSVTGVTPVYQSGDVNGDGYLNQTETWVYEYTGTATEGQYENVGSVTGDYEDETVSDEDLSHYEGVSKEVPTASPLITAGLLGAVLVMYLKRSRKQ